MMGKEIRFSILVKQSGKPETLTLWENPKNNSVVIKAVKENRMMTIIQHPGGKGKDFGQIGFHQQPGALYLVFPKKVKAAASVRVIGLNYDLMAETAAPLPPVKEKAMLRGKVDQKKEKPPLEKPCTIKPTVEKRFEVAIRRVAVVERKFTVTAKNKGAAKTLAMKEIAHQDLKASHEEVRDKILATHEIKAERENPAAD